MEAPITYIPSFVEHPHLAFNALQQDNWMHRIPKAAFQCGARISLTFRGYVKGEA